jgi:enoyl-CoA hydratase/carnithine racemase
VHERVFAACADLMLTIHRLRQPVIARVQGIATAAGCQLVAACDLAVAAESARFGAPGVKIGLFCTTPLVEVARVVGPTRAAEMLLTGEPIDARTALQWGLVNRVVPLEHLDDEAVALAGRVVAASGETLAIGKRALYENLDLPLEEAYRHASGVMCRNAVTDDAQEGIAAFLEKRPPVWGR